MWQALAGRAVAADSTEFWPELNAFIGLSPRTRLHLATAYAEGKESDTTSLDLAAYLDISLKPIARKELLTEDWQRSRYFWARIGYARIFKATTETGPDVAEDRGIVSLATPTSGRSSPGSVPTSSLSMAPPSFARSAERHP